MAYKLSKKLKVQPMELPCKKTMYNTREEAEDIITYINENHTGKEIHAYKCLVCGFWHLTSKTK